MSDVVSGKEPTGHPEIMHHREGFDFVPGNRSLSAVEVSLVNVMSRETVLRQYVDSVKRDYDYVLLDCRPSLGMLVINALSASDYVLIPVQADYLAAEDMTELVGTVRSIQRQINPRLKIGGRGACAGPAFWSDHPGGLRPAGELSFLPAQDRPPGCRRSCFCQLRPFDLLRLSLSVSPFWGSLLS